MQKNSKQLHELTLEIAKKYKKCEAELIDVLIRVHNEKVYAILGYSSLFAYIVRELGLSESVAYNLMAVSKAVRVVPELKAKIENGSINLSSARRIAPVLTRENQTECFTKASTLSQRALEKEITKIRPQAATPEKAKYTSPDRVKLELGLSERTMLRFRKLQRSATFEETLEFMMNDFENHAMIQS